MKVVFVTANLPHGTDEAFIVPEIDQLIRAGHEVMVIPRSPKGPVIHSQALLRYTRREPLYSAEVFTRAARTGIRAPLRSVRALGILLKSRTPKIAAKNAAVLPKAFWLASVARDWGAEHIYSHWAGTTATMAMVASELSGIPWSFTAHRWDVVENNLLREKVKRARLARFISEDGLKMAKEIGIGAAANARVLFMGVDLPAEVQRRSGQWPIVLCPARLVEVKGHRFLLEAWRILRACGVHGELWLAGDGELRPELESLVRSFGLENSVRFLGTLAHEDLMQVYRDAPVSAVVLASTDLGQGVHEGIPVALIEAMGHGIPVVATATGGTPELVRPGTGFLVPPANSTALADALHNLLQDKALIEQIGNRARRHVVERHDIVGVTYELAQAMADAAGQHNVSAVA